MTAPALSAARPFSARATANNRWEVMDHAHGELVALALGRRNAALVVEALNARYGHGDQLELFEPPAA